MPNTEPTWHGPEFNRNTEQCTYMTAVAVKARGEYLIKAFDNAVSDDYPRMPAGEYLDPAFYTAVAHG